MTRSPAASVALRALAAAPMSSTCTSEPHSIPVSPAAAAVCTTASTSRARRVTEHIPGLSVISGTFPLFVCCLTSIVCWL
ncbi:hypothetical protein QE394_000079 [Arthrobacter sp. SORGH_AS 212]|nr:hypothetical protein [Arthrobacter sp. SORGH_AS_0212]